MLCNSWQVYSTSLMKSVSKDKFTKFILTEMSTFSWATMERWPNKNDLIKMCRLKKLTTSFWLDLTCWAQSKSYEIWEIWLFEILTSRSAFILDRSLEHSSAKTLCDTISLEVMSSWHSKSCKRVLTIQFVSVKRLINCWRRTNLSMTRYTSRRTTR
jgi:hypothetical protein